MACYEKIKCPGCDTTNVIKSGTTSQGKQRYYCQNTDCQKKTFILDYQHNARKPGVKKHILAMTINGSGIRDIARVLSISKTTVLNTLKKKQPDLVASHPDYPPASADSQSSLTVSAGQCRLEAEVDEQWSFVGNKRRPRWLWYAIDHARNTILAYAFGRRQDGVFKALKKLLAPFQISHYYTDNWATYERCLETQQHTVGKSHTQNIERKNLNLRTWIKRLARKTICFSKSDVMHDTVIGLLINDREFGRNIYA